LDMMRTVAKFYLGIIICVFFVHTSGHTLQTNITELIRRYGYPVEVHKAQTPDGYILTLHRIPHGKNNTQATKGAVFLQHGLTDASAGFAMNPPDRALSYILADSGFDVWLGNNRGNGYSMENIYYPPSDARFWNFCWDDMGSSDFPTSISYVLQQTGETKLSYIGHSEGTIQAFAGLIANPALASKLKVYIALAPVAYVGQLSVQLLKVLAEFDADYLLKLLGANEFEVGSILHILLPELCRFDPSACDFGSEFIYGKDTYLNASMLDIYTEYEPFPTSVKNIIHWAQSVRANTFSKFDYGAQGNIQKYGQPTPPPYKLSDFPANLPTVLFTGGIDGLADSVDVQRLLSEISVKPKVYNRDDYGHLDPLLGETAYRDTYPSVISELESHM